MKVEVYFNLHKRLFSVRALNGENKGKVIKHCESVLIKNASFIVRQSGRNKVIENGQKNVHAFIRGELQESETEIEREGIKRVIYDPYRFDSFMLINDEKLEKIESAELVYLEMDDGQPIVTV